MCVFGRKIISIKGHRMRGYCFIWVIGDGPFKE